MFDLANIIQTVGYVGLFVIVFTETGLFIGFFLPGDSLLFTAGLLASQGVFNIYALLVILFCAAVVGDSTGYFIGHKFGKKLFEREHSRLFNKEHLLRAKHFYEKHGGKTIILARFIPVIRTFAPVVAGMADMKYSTFLFFNVIGGVFWAIGMPVLGFFLGTSIPDIDQYLLPIVALIIFISILPGLVETTNTAQKREKLVAAVKAFLSSWKK